MQTTMSDSYTLICNLVDSVDDAASLESPSQSDLGESLHSRQSNLSSSARRGTYFGTYKPNEVNHSMHEFDSIKRRFCSDIFVLLNEIRSNSLPNAEVDDDIAEDTANWRDDVMNCNVVLNFIGERLQSANDLFFMRDLLRSLITLLQRDEHGRPLDFVAWDRCAHNCRMMEERGEFDVDITTSSYSPIHGVGDDSDLLVPDSGNEKENAGNSIMNDMVQETVKPAAEREGERERGRARRLTDTDVNARMNNLRNRVLERHQLEGAVPPIQQLNHEEVGHESVEENTVAVVNSAPVASYEGLPSRKSSEHSDSRESSRDSQCDESVGEVSDGVGGEDAKAPSLEKRSVSEDIEESNDHHQVAARNLLTRVFSGSDVTGPDSDGDSDEENKDSKWETSLIGTPQGNTDSLMAHPSARLFLLLDRSGKGGLTREEFLSGVKQNKKVGKALRLEDGQGLSDKACIAVFEAMDTDKSSHVDLQKFLAYLDRKFPAHPLQDDAIANDNSGENDLNDRRHACDEPEQVSVSESAPSQEKLPITITGDKSEKSTGTLKQERMSRSSSLQRTDSMKRDDITAANVFSKMESLKAKIFTNNASPSAEKQNTEDSRGSKDVVETKKSSHPKAYMFQMMDRNNDGELSLTEFIVALRAHPEISSALKLPQVIRQEDGSRDKCVHAFNDMDHNNSDFIDIHKFLKYYDDVNGSNPSSSVVDSEAEKLQLPSSHSDPVDDDKPKPPEVTRTPFLTGLLERADTSGE